jgi:gamma-glutamylcyclotransferase (GGCT)/AIG2-like uncharacterized protein YtfP
LSKQIKPFNLFVYGTLMSPMVFRAVLGRRMVFDPLSADGTEAFWAQDAVLNYYTKISPDNTYLYAVPDPHGRIRGYLIGPLPGELMESLRRYEGRNYSRQRVRVQTKDGMEEAVAFTANLQQLEHAFGYEFKDSFKQEILLREKIEAALLETEREQLQTNEQSTRRAVGELHGSTIRDIVRRHFEAGGISDYAIRHSLKDRPLRDYNSVISDPEAQALAPNYLAMVLRQVLFNEIEDKVRQDFRYELDHMAAGPEFYDRTVSALVSLRLLNANAPVMDLLVGDSLTDLSFTRDRLVDFVRWGVEAADSLYENPAAKRELDLIRTHMGQGFTPMGAELEFSNIGHGVIRDPQGSELRDSRYDGFFYFADFGLDALTWKLGGHVDNHHEKASTRRRRGFFEIALGSLSIEANLSKPVTDDPWLLNQFIHEARRFYPITPHSVHISLQIRSQHRPARNRTLPLGVLKCLFALGGDPQRDLQGAVRIRRLTTDEIINADPVPHMLFSEISRRHSRNLDEGELVRPGHASGRYVQQFKFLRLAPELNYEPLVIALKGLQLALSPGSFITPSQYQTSRRHRELFESLIHWGVHPTPLSDAEIGEFITTVGDGLAGERRGKPAHTGAYIAWSLHQLRSLLGRFNSLLGGERQ